MWERKYKIVENCIITDPCLSSACHTVHISVSLSFEICLRLSNSLKVRNKRKVKKDANFYQLHTFENVNIVIKNNIIYKIWIFSVLFLVMYSHFYVYNILILYNVLYIEQLKIFLHLYKKEYIQISDIFSRKGRSSLDSLTSLHEIDMLKVVQTTVEKTR